MQHYHIHSKPFLDSFCKFKDNQFEVVELLIVTIEQIITYCFTINDDSNIFIYNNRIFYHCSHKRIFSIYFPFDIDKDEECYSVKLDKIVIDFNLIRIMKHLLKQIKTSEAFEDICYGLDSIDTNESFEVLDIQVADFILKMLLFYEYGYIRYDEDKESMENHGEEYHPLYHLDIFFNKHITCKFGLLSSIDVHDFDKILDNKERRRYIVESYKGNK